MQTLTVIDAQNELSAEGQRPVPIHGDALAAIQRLVDAARRSALLHLSNLGVRVLPA